MNIFSKWFGSDKQEEQEEQIEVFFEEDTPKQEQIIEPQNTPEAIRYVVEKWGADYLEKGSLLNILNDFQVLKDIPAAKYIIQNMQQNGYIEKITTISNWEIESKSITTKYVNEFGAKDELVHYIVQCIGYGLKQVDDLPQLLNDSEKPSSTDSNSQKIDLNSDINVDKPSNSPAIDNSSYDDISLPYDHKRDLPNYQYPTIELLNNYSSNPEILPLKSIFSDFDFQDTTMELPCAIGKKASGELLMFDLAELPHLMISGASGMGISVLFNTIITSLIYKKHPAEMKLLLFDPKKIEFSLYSSLKNYFLAGLPSKEPIISDIGGMSEVIISLTKEMEVRLDLLKDAGVRNIKDYNRKFSERRLDPVKGHKYMPHIVILIDEYDIISNYYGKSIETPLENLSRTGRSVGIHLVISVLRPVGSVISAGIKANVTSRIAFRVTSVNESRNILGIGGAEKLQRPGEILYTNGIDLFKAQCAFIDIEEIDRINNFISQQQGYPNFFELPDPNFEEYNEPDVDMQHLDPMFEDAARLIVINQSGSTSLIQRKFAIGYNRAGRLMNQLEKAGIVGPAYGAKPREVLIQDEMSLERVLAQWSN